MSKKIKSTSLMSLVFSIIMVSFGSSIAQASTYTLVDVAAHNTPTDCWVVVNNNVYNLTSFISSHSGGSSVIKAQCGKDGTTVFNSGPHRVATLSAISSSLLGSLTTVSPVITNPKSVKITPAFPSLQVDKTIQLKAKIKDQTGKIITGAVVTFSSSDDTIAKVDSATGVVTAVAKGFAIIKATGVYGGETVTGTTVIKVIKANNGKHLGQNKNWSKKFFNKSENKLEKKIEKNERKNEQNNEREDNDD